MPVAPSVSKQWTAQMDKIKPALKYIVPALVGLLAGLGIDLGVVPEPECSPGEQKAQEAPEAAPEAPQPEGE